MIKLTPTAEQALTDVRDQAGKPDDFGVRFFVKGSAMEQSNLAFDFVEAPMPGDQIDKEGGLETYVATEVDEMVGDAVVDIETVDQQPSLVLRRAEPQNGVG